MTESKAIAPGTTQNWHLERPFESHPSLRAWDAADEYILAHLAEQTKEKLGRVLIINDAFGYLSLDLNQHQPSSTGDSYLAYQATKHNFKLNGLDPEQCLNWADFLSLSESEQAFDTVIIKIPKSLALLKDTLIRLRSLLAPDAKIIGAGMLKYLRKSMIDAFAEHIGPTTTSLAKKKARLVFASLEPALSCSLDYPKRWVTDTCELNVLSHAGIFSSDKLDIGTRFMLEHLPALGVPETVVDLGCGNGLLGIYAKRLNPGAQIHFCDESYRAIASAKASWQLNGFDLQGASFRVDDGLTAFVGEVEQILFNPPFHQNNTITTETALRLFKQSRQHLRAGGELVIVANRHLPYLPALKKLFRQVRKAWQNDKFIIYRAKA